MVGEKDFGITVIINWKWFSGAMWQQKKKAATSEVNKKNKISTLLCMVYLEEGNKD